MDDYGSYVTDESEDEDEQYKNKIRELPLEEFYAVLDNENDLDYTPTVCPGQMQTDVDIGEKLSNLCRKVEYKLKHFSDIKSVCNTIPDKKFCDYFNYWLGNEVRNINTNSNKVMGIANTFNMIASSLVYNGCTCKKGNFTNAQFSKCKQFFDFTENLEGINNIKNKFTTSDDNFYCTYIKKAVNEYNKIMMDGLCKNNSCVYYAEFQGFKNRYNELYSSLNSKCWNDLPCLVNEQGKYEPPCKPPSYGDPQMARLNTQLPHTEGSDSESTNHALITSVCTVLLMSAFTFILYKFSPFGSWLHHKVLKKKNALDNIDEEDYQFLHPFVVENLNSDEKTYNISHYPL
ncbi:PIR Superfamily Protein [Plasmodium ovale wallikeri]|uniref:PIR Superfamily Protein n=2 Tax=Plasmodium ovale TaxID=36330 RepID=A0A1A9A5T9_PLAOA|nr:PIR Superfamily Protein [Plasmodium ovale wallikeri]SBT54049.1 PIR Superfamily Protein [Plasmodium ovale wallikeri]SBT76564.1 Plasmodium vivax Vir protein, putative [Plasmodium ovale]